jgi:PAS domain S-box-containing protein
VWPPSNLLGELRETDQTYRAIFDAAGDGLVVYDRASGAVLEANPAFCRMHGHRDMAGLRPAGYLHPDSQDALDRCLRTVEAAGEHRWHAQHVRSDGTIFEVEVAGRPFSYAGRPAVLGVVRDLTQRRHDDVSALEHRRLQELEALYRADAVLHRSLQLDDVLQALVEVATGILNADKASVLVWDAAHERLVARAAHGYSTESVARLAFAPDEGIAGIVVRTRQTVMVEDLHSDARASPRITRLTDAEGIRSLICIPILVGGEVYGLFNSSFCGRRSFSAEDGRPFEGLAQRAALAIENARLFEQAEQRAREIGALVQADQQLHQSLHLDEVLQALLDVAASVLHFDQAAVAMLDPLGQRLVMRATRGLSPDLLRDSVGADEAQVVRETLAGDAAAIEDVRTDVRLNPHLRAMADREGTRAAISVPIRLGGQVFGSFTLGYRQPRRFGEAEKRLVMALGQRTALAVQNARLFEQAQQAAVLEERQRLARELHDAVTQTLFSASLLADVLPRLLERNPAEAGRRLEELRTLTRGALAEMRALLVELRPSALEETPLADLLQRLAEAATGRTHLRAMTRVSGRCARPLPAEAQIVLYRIAQEALNNIVKHARARNALVELAYTSAGSVRLRISDDGCGFDPQAVPAGHLGLGIMRERVASIGARLRIDSREGEGTHIEVTWRSPRRSLTSTARSDGTPPDGRA